MGNSTLIAVLESEKAPHLRKVSDYNFTNTLSVGLNLLKLFFKDSLLWASDQLILPFCKPTTLSVMTMAKRKTNFSSFYVSISYFLKSGPPPRNQNQADLGKCAWIWFLPVRLFDL